MRHQCRLTSSHCLQRGHELAGVIFYTHTGQTPKWVKKQCLYGKYYPTSADFQAAIQQCIAQAHSDHLAELESLLTLKFQTFTEVLVLGEEAKVDSSPGEKQKQAQVSLFPKRKQAQKKVSSKAA